MEFNLCTSSQGEFSLCAKDKPTPRPVAPPAPSNPSRGQRPKTFNDGYGSGGANSGGGGLAGWAVPLIVIIVLILAFCIAYYVWKSMRYNRDDKGMSNNIYLDQNKDRGFDGRSYAGQTAARSTRTKRTRQSSLARPGSHFVCLRHPMCTHMCVPAEPRRLPATHHLWARRTRQLRLKPPGSDVVCL